MPAPHTHPVIGLIGRKRTGKDTLARRLVERHGFTRVAFADTLKALARAVDPIIHTYPDSVGGAPYVVRLSEALDELGEDGVKDVYPEYRRFLERHGVASRELLGAEVWCAAGVRRILAVRGPVIVTDVRFPNEAEAIRKRGGYLVRVERAGLPDDGDTHPSEVALDGYPVNLVLHNDGPLESFIDAVGAMGPHLRYLYTYPRA